MPSKVPLRGVRLPDELYLKLRFIAKKETRSFAQQSAYILQKFVDEYESEHGEISVDTDDLYQ